MLMLSSLAALVVGFFTTFSDHYLAAQFAWVSPLLIVIGCFTLVSSGLGFFGAKCHGTFLLFVYFVVQLVLLCVLVWIAASANAMGDRAVLKGIIDETCQREPRPTWCPSDADINEALDAMQSHLGAIKWVTCFISATLLANACAAFLSAAGGRGPTSQDSELACRIDPAENPSWSRA